MKMNLATSKQYVREPGKSSRRRRRAPDVGKGDRGGMSSTAGHKHYLFSRKPRMTQANAWTSRNGIRKDITAITTKATQPRGRTFVKRSEATAKKISHVTLPIDPSSRASLRTPSEAFIIVHSFIAPLITSGAPSGPKRERLLRSTPSPAGTRNRFGFCGISWVERGTFWAGGLSGLDRL